MAKIYSYLIITDEFTSHKVREPHYAADEQRITELCTINGLTYISVPDSVVLPIQPEQVVLTECVPTPELTDAIKTASAHVHLVNERIKTKIRERYDAETEMYFARISIGAITGQYTMEPGEAEKVVAYGAYVEEVRQWGRDQRALLGL